MTTKKAEVQAGPKAKANPLPKGEEKGAVKSPYEIVVMGEAAKRFKNNMWEGMVRQASISVSTSKKKGRIATVVQRSDFEALMREGEEKYMKQYHGKNPEAKNKAKEWKFRTYLPASYRTAKSVAVNCIEQGVPMTVGDTVIGKTACEDAYKLKTLDPAKGMEPVKTPWEKWEGMLDTADKLMVKLNDTEFTRACEQLATRGRNVRKTDSKIAA